MHWILDYELIFFDFDGLLVNTEHLHFKAYQQLLHAHGVSFPWDLSTFVGIAHQSSDQLRATITDHCPELIEKNTWETLYREKQRYYGELLQSQHLEYMPGVPDLLKIVQQQQISHAVVTNSTYDQVSAIQRHLPLLKSIPIWVTREDYHLPKPAPDAYLKAIKILGGAREKMVGFEDALRGIRALNQAHITPVLICSPDHPQLSQIKQDSLAYFPSFKELLVSV
ncbi:MAG: HAD family phosphatase [Chlamydiota bacterium]